MRAVCPWTLMTTGFLDFFVDFFAGAFAISCALGAVVADAGSVMPAASRANVTVPAVRIFLIDSTPDDTLPSNVTVRVKV